ncbi:hypothetical protein THF1C08_30206 [Vibrio jasicida]|uniref:Uncharacterized protein n=1 Tax=Vibrio jasicida TaxID=766224 RepID=A0AAU9QUR6_9VIBR|nr:hypothetical protein THF1C08_30206 [Vibrio jasicida]CAH1599663.1 hypothetical protein THF1A12_40229 [Vibrio jasicida]
MFRGEIVANFEPGAGNDYPGARYVDHGEMVFFEGNGLRKALNEGRSYVLS